MERARLLNDRRRVQGDDSRSPLASAASWSRFENITGRLNCRLPNGLNEPGTAEIGGELAERTEKTADKSTEEAKNSGGDNSRGIGSNDSKVLRSKSKRERAINALKARFSAFYLFLCACGGWKLGSESGSFRFRRMNCGGESTSLESFDNTTDNDGSASSKSFSNISSPSNDNKEKERAKVTLASSVLWHARQNDVSAVEKLLEQDPSLVTARDYDGRTALHAAALHGSLDVAKCLIAHGAEINAQDRWQNSPLADAEGANQQRMMDLLKEYGGKSLGNHGSREAKTVAPPLPQKCDWEIDPSEIDFSTSQLVGKGSFGEILKASWRGTPVAVKRILPSLSDDRLIVQDFRHEVELLVKLRHPNIVQFLGAVTKTPPLMLITEFLRGGDLHQFLKEKGALPASTAVNFALDMARGMTYLHNGPNVIIHRDLKPRNILMVDSNHLKVGDFGLSKLINVKHAHDMYKLTGETGSYRYMAPEVFEHRRYDTKVDVFSFAMILYQMFEGAPPYPNLDPYEAAKLVAKGDRPLFRARSYPADLKELIENCWDAEIQNRPSFLAILSKLEKIKENLPHEHHHWNFLHHT